MIFLGIILDLIIIVLISIFAFISARRGFVRTLVETVGFILIIILANSICAPLANSTYDNLIEPTIINSVDNIDSKAASDITDTLIEKIPLLSDKVNVNSGIVKDFEGVLSNEINNGVKSAVSSASQTVFKPVITRVISMVYSLLITVILMYFVNLLAKLISKLITHTFLKKTNLCLGGVLGIIKGVAVACVICTVISLIISVTDNGFWIFTESAVNSSYIFKHLCFFG